VFVFQSKLSLFIAIAFQSLSLPMKYQTQDTDFYTLVSIKADKMDTILAPDLKGHFINCATQHPSKALIIDLGGVKFADSSGLSALLMAHRLYRDNNSTCIIASASQRVLELLEISQLNKVFSLAETVEAAASMLGGADS
jgi:anti-anti-sigma factor